MKIIRVAMQLALAAAMPAVLSGQSQTPTAASEISATGSAEVRLPPDHAVVYATVESRSPTAREASSANGSVTNKVVQALRKAGSPADMVTTSDFVVEQRYRYDGRPPEQVPDGFEAHATVRTETSRIDEVPALIDAALEAGATRITVQYSSTKASDARLAVIEGAYATAKRDALALAHAAGGSLGRLLSASPSGGGPAISLRGVNQLQALVVTSGAPTLIPGNITSSATVSARWEFLPGGS